MGTPPHGAPRPTWRHGALLRSPERSPGRLEASRGTGEPALTSPQHTVLALSTTGHHNTGTLQSNTGTFQSNKGTFQSNSGAFNQVEREPPGFCESPAQGSAQYNRAWQRGPPKPKSGDAARVAVGEADAAPTHGTAACLKWRLASVRKPLHNPPWPSGRHAAPVRTP